MKILLLALLVSSPALANDFPPGFSGARWEQLLAHAKRDGQTIQSQAGPWQSLSRVVPDDRSQPRTADYFGVLVESNQITQVSPVTETWTKGDFGSWNIDQRIFHVTLFGQFVSIQHFRMMRTAGGYIKNRTEVTDTDGPAQWEKKLADWEN